MRQSLFRAPRSHRLALVCLCLVLPLAVQASPLEQARLANGLELLLKESHGGPMVASIVTVGAGARFEDAQNYGASHFLEHMVFNGTATRSREDINEGIKAYGGYINAFTRREYTCYILLIPREYLHEGLAIQADMLFGSLLPPEEFEKEKRVVLEEMKKDYDSGSYRGDLHRNAHLLAGTPYAHPILGTMETIERLRREDVFAYYKERYQPGNCRLFLVGDFEREPALAMLDSLFGAVPGRPTGVPEPVQPSWPATPPLHAYRAEEGAPRLDLVWLAPPLSSGDAPALFALAEMLTDAHRSPLRGEAEPALELSAGLELFADFSLFTLTLETGEADPAPLLAALRERLGRLGGWVPDTAWTAELANRLRVDDILLQDTYHYYAMMKSAELHLGGYPFLAKYREQVGALDPAALRGALERSLLGGAPKLIWSAQAADTAAATLPGGLSPAGFALAPTVGTSLPVDAAAPLRPHSPASASGGEESGEERLRLANGLTVLLRSDPSSEVCAAHVLVRGRSASEPSGREGMVALAHELLTAGTQRRDEAALAAALSGLGARLKVGDDPYLPFDDYYTREDFSFLRLEALDETADAAFALLAEMLAEASYPDAAVEREKATLIAGLRMGSQRPSEVAREALGETIYAGGPRGRTLRGTPASLGAISAEELRAFHRQYFVPERMILSVVSGLPLPALRRVVETRFGALASGAGGELPSTALAAGPAEVLRPQAKAQVALLAARVLPPAGAQPDGLEVLVDVLSARLGLELREKQGLAYSVGAGLSHAPGLAADEPGFGLITLQIATGAENRERARTGLRSELERLATEPPGREEVFRAVNGRWGRELMRDLARIHQAYRLGLREHLGLDPFATDVHRIARQRSTGTAELAALARQYLLQDDWIWVLAGGGLQ